MNYYSLRLKSNKLQNNLNSLEIRFYFSKAKMKTGVMLKSCISKLNVKYYINFYYFEIEHV